MADGYFKQRYYEGEWVAAEGQIWLLPDSQVMAPFDQHWHRSIAGIDWGYQHAFACEVIVETSTGKRHVVDEVYARGRTVNQLIPTLLALRQRWGIEHFYADPSQPGYIADCQSQGLPVTAAVNDVLPGITAVSDEIQKGLTVAPACAGLLTEMPGYVWAQTRGSGNAEGRAGQAQRRRLRRPALRRDGPALRLAGRV